MAQRGAVDGWDPPSVVQVTVVPGPRGSIGGARAGGLATRGAASLIVVGAAVCALLAGGWVPMLHRGAPRPTTVVPTRAVAAEAVPLAAAAQAYRFPLGCLRITHTREALAGAIRRRTDPCWRYGVYVTAILKRVDGTWRLALEASGGSCARNALPALVQDRLSMCRR